MSNVKETKYDKTLIIVIVVEVVATFRACSSAPLRPCLNVQIESVHKICPQNLSKIKLCDWPNKLDTTS